MDEKRVISAGSDMIYLASCALQGRICDKDTLATMELDLIYKLSKFHSMQAIVYISLAKCIEKYGDGIIDAELLSKWKGDYHAAVKKLVLFDIERDELCKFLADKGAWYLCLKGVVLQHYYPTLGMRQMTDNDILVDTKACADIRDYFSAKGYTVYSYGKGCHDTYLRGQMTFEIHRKLFSEAVRTKRGSDYYKNVKAMLKPGERPCEMLFGDEDFYVYFLYHSYKHYATAGCGVRTLMDIYAYRSKNTGLDTAYIDKQLKTLGIEDYEARSRELAFAIFSPDVGRDYVLSDELEGMLENYITSGTFGTTKKLIENNVEDMAAGERVTALVKIRYLFKRIFPGMDYYREAHPKASRWIITIPFLWLIRIFRGIRKRKTLAYEVETLNKIK